MTTMHYWAQITLPDQAAEHLSRAADAALGDRADLRRTPRSELHITLGFFGDERNMTSIESHRWVHRDQREGYDGDH